MKVGLEALLSSVVAGSDASSSGAASALRLSLCVANTRRGSLSQMAE